jgi:hypothetical protein
MLRKPTSIESYSDAYSFIMFTDASKRKAAFNAAFPIDPIEDVIPEGETEPDWFERIERHTDEKGDAAVLAAVLNHMDGDYLLELRSSIHEAQWIVTTL